MTKVAADITISLDGYVTAPGADPEHGLGVGGEPLHAWVLASDDPVDAEVLREATDASGAVIMGRKLFDTIDGPHGWNDERGYGADLAATPPFFVVTHRPPASVRLPLQFTFVTDGIAAAIEQARPVAGDKEVVVMGGGETVRRAFDAGLLDELRIHLSPIVFGGGTPLFGGGTRREMTQRAARVSKHATHLVYEL